MPRSRRSSRQPRAPGVGPLIVPEYPAALQSMGRYLALGLMMGTAILTLLGGLSACLLVGIPRAASVLPLLVLPLMAPVVIFGSGAVRAWQLGVDPAAPLYFLGSLFALSATALPWACASALRNAYD